MTAPSTGAGRITRDDIEAKLRQIRGDADTAGEAAKGVGGVLGVAAMAAAVVVAFALGRRRGRRSSTVVEVRRF